MTPQVVESVFLTAFVSLIGGTVWRVCCERHRGREYIDMQFNLCIAGLMGLALFGLRFGSPLAGEAAPKNDSQVPATESSAFSAPRSDDSYSDLFSLSGVGAAWK